MELLDGRSLMDVLSVEGSLPLERAARILAQVGLSLAEAHRKGVLHRDLKPDNIFIADVDGTPDFVKVIDFGIAQLLTEESKTRITQAGFVCGTPEYMSPEQARGDALDARTDLYSAGVILFEMLEGRLPFEADTPLGTALAHQTQPVPDVDALHPEGIRDLARRLLAKVTAERPKHAEAMVSELQAALPKHIRLSGIELREPVSPVAHTVPAGKAADPIDTRDLVQSLPGRPGHR